jgi:N-acetylglucosaminyldiphosphoundecaprenol N-acetyl-beta-D-mannosaminyltransferase
MRQKILGCEVDNLSMGETLDRVGELIATGRPHQHVVINADKVVKANRDPALARIIARCDLINADGMPVVWASRLLGEPLKERVTGVDLFFELLGRAEQRGWRIYFLGAREEVVSEVVRRARQRHPRLQIAGHRNGYWRPDEEQAVVDRIALAGPHILFVAINSPKKEEFLARHQKHMQVPFAMGVGGTFDVMAGLTKRAPVWMQRTGLEWFYRFLQEPRRMFRRYFIDGMGFFWLLGQAMLQRRDTRRADRQAS